MEKTVAFMKYLIVILCWMPLVTFSQTQSDYENVMNRFVKFYNAQQADSIDHMYGANWDYKRQVTGRPMWSSRRSAGAIARYGTIQSIKFIGIDEEDPNKYYVFKTVFSIAGTKTMTLLLDKDNLFLDFRFDVSSPHLQEMLQGSE